MSEAPKTIAHPERATQKTYWHLQAARRIPSDYEVVTSRLLFHPEIPYAVRTPVSEWIERHRAQGIAVDDAAFADPRATTYASYVGLKHEQEVRLDGICNAAREPALGRGALAAWQGIFAVVRYPLHALQMLASAAGSLAPSGRVAVALLFQAADEMQRVHRLAFRLAQVRIAAPGLGDDARQRWETDAAWQPLRALIERMLVTFDWQESFAALNLAFKPAWEEQIFRRSADAAHGMGDERLAALLGCLGEDSRWHADWSAAAIAALWPAPQDGRLEEAAARWRPAVRDALAPLDAALAKIAGQTER